MARIEQFNDHIEAWLHHAWGERGCVYALIGFLKAQPTTTPAELGLPSVRRITVRPDGPASTSSFLLVDWLEQLCDSGAISTTR